MTNSNWNFIKSQTVLFAQAFNGAMALLIAEIIDWRTTKGDDGNYLYTDSDIYQWDIARVKKAYELMGQNGNMSKFHNDLRPLFQEIDENNVYFPFTVADGKLDVDTAETVLYTYIKDGGMFNYWAKATSDLMYINSDNVNVKDSDDLSVDDYNTMFKTTTEE